MAIRFHKGFNGDYNLASNFMLEIDGVVQGGFQEITGIEASVEVIEYRDGSHKELRKRPGRVKYGDLTLKRGQVQDKSLYMWFKEVVDGKTNRKSGAVIIPGRDGAENVRYNFFEAFPIKWKAPDLNSKSDTFQVEEVTLTCEKIEMESK